MEATRRCASLRLAAEPRQGTEIPLPGAESLPLFSSLLSTFRWLCSLSSPSLGWNIVDLVMVCKFDKKLPENDPFLCSQAAEVGGIVLVSDPSQNGQAPLSRTR